MIAFANGTPSPDLLRLQAIEKQLAARFFQWSERQGLTAFLVCGSALGAMRHGDMIPWDDDIDIGMLRADFERLFASYEGEPIPGTYLQSHRCELRYPYPFAKLRLDGTRVTEPTFGGRKTHSGIFIDIFPFDALPRSGTLRRVQRAALGLLNLFIMPPSRAVLAVTPSVPLRLAKRIAGWLHPALPMRPLIAMREWWAQLPVAGKSGIVDSFGMYGIRFGPETPIAAELLVPPVKSSFGEISVWLPRDCEQYLTSLFGDYRQLPPEAMRQPGHVTAIDFGNVDRADSDARLAAEPPRS